MVVNTKPEFRRPEAERHESRRPEIQKQRADSVVSWAACREWRLH